MLTTATLPLLALPPYGPERDAMLTALAPAGVAKGAALLDERRPGWHHDINLHALDMSNNELCILGQLYDYWTFGLVALQINDVYEYGICGYAPALRQAWCDAITQRRIADQESVIAATAKELVNA